MHSTVVKDAFVTFV